MMDDLTAFQRDRLVVLNGIEPATGIEIQDELDGYYESEVSGGRFYPSIDQLVAEGFVEKQSKDGRANLYILTEQGAQRLRERNSWNDHQLN